MYLKREIFNVSYESRVIVIGNGFDLNCKLKSSYEDFFEYSCKNDSFYKKLEQISKVVLKGKTVLIDNLSSIVRNISFNKNDGNIWDVYFYFYSKIISDLNEWCNVEDAIKNSLDKKFTFNWNNAFNIFINCDINCCFGTIPTINNLISAFLDLVFNCDRSMDFYNFLFSQLKMFEKKFSDYLCKQIKNNDLYLENASKLIKKMQHDNDYEYNDIILSFNFTLINKTYLFKGVSGIDHIHGDLENKNVIFGISNDALKPSDKDFIFTKLYRNNLIFDKDSYIKSIAFRYDGIVFFGLSLNQQDYQDLFSILKRYDFSDIEDTPYFIFYYSIYGNKTKNQIKNEMLKKVQYLFFNYFDSINLHSSYIYSILLNSGKIKILEI